MGQYTWLHRLSRGLKAASYYCAVAALFGLTCFSLYLNRTASSGVAAAMMLALILLRHLPILESFEVLTLKAKFRDRLDEAEVLLGHLRQSARAYGRTSYIQLSYMDRMTDVPWPIKRGLLGEIDRLLLSLDIDKDELAGFRRPFLNLVSVDLARAFEQTVAHRCAWYADQVHKKMAAIPQPITVGSEYHSLAEDLQRATMPHFDWGQIITTDRLENIRPELLAWMATAPLSAADRDKLQPLLDEVSTLSEACWAAGTITAAAESFLSDATDALRTDARARKLFGDEIK